MTQAEADVHPDVIIITLLVNNVHAYILFNTGAILSFISSSFIKKLVSLTVHLWGLLFLFHMGRIILVSWNSRMFP